MDFIRAIIAVLFIIVIGALALGVLAILHNIAYDMYLNENWIGLFFVGSACVLIDLGLLLGVLE